MRLDNLGIFPSRLVEPRRVEVWVPSGAPPYSVLYMHDGQNLFRPETSFIGVDWDIPGALGRLNRFGSVPSPLVVGVWNTPWRLSEYMPARALPFAPENSLLDMARPGLSDLYLRFLVEELKPVIDRRYPTRPAEPAAVMGSSMGGLISLYAVCEYPEVFNRAGCLSTHWPIGDGACVTYLEKALPRPGSARFYFDYGTKTADAPYEPYQRRVDSIMRAAGYRLDVDWLTCKFPGEDHSERAWRGRVAFPLEFLTR